MQAHRKSSKKHSVSRDGASVTSPRCAAKAVATVTRKGKPSSKADDSLFSSETSIGASLASPYKKVKSSPSKRNVITDSFFSPKDTSSRETASTFPLRARPHPKNLPKHSMSVPSECHLSNIKNASSVLMRCAPGFLLPSIQRLSFLADKHFKAKDSKTLQTLCS